jgi:prepilin-type N-terminal cleavage/methylation domain-containing protein
MRVLDRRTRARGFTLIELLVVIAIIAILAALLFPVMATVRAQAHQNSCQAQMADVVRALKMYQDDWRVYPDALFGIDYGDGAGFRLRLYPDYVKDRKTFNCPYSPVKLTPENQAIPITNVINGMTNNVHEAAPGVPVQYATWSSYDFQFRPRTTTGLRELRYNPKWTAVAPSLTDDRRQLIYRNPPDSTVVSWCLYHTDMGVNGMPAPKRLALVAFLSGRVQTVPADQLQGVAPGNWGGGPAYPWNVSPKP